MGPVEYTSIEGARSAEMSVRVVDGTSRNVAGNNRSRCAICFSGDTTNAIFVTTLPIAVDGQGFRIPPNSSPLVLTRREVGGLVQLAWNAIAPAGNSNLTVTEIIACEGLVP